MNTQEFKRRIKEVWDEKVNKRYRLKNRVPRKGIAVIFIPTKGKYSDYWVYATYDPDRNVWTGHSGITDGVHFPAYGDDVWWECD